MHVDLTDLSLFRHVVEAGSITHGAERANLALAAASGEKSSKSSRPRTLGARIPKRYVGDRGHWPVTICSRRQALPVFR